tara:strand:+ start:1386 stop:1889 length:504 start_codon:yes stop_codon:yes gene_type:complete
MFGFGIGGKVALVLGAVLVAMAGAFYFYFNWSQSEIGVLKQNAAKLEVAVQTQKTTISDLHADIAKRNDINEKLFTDYQKSRLEVSDLKKKFNKKSKLMGSRDIGKLATAHAGRIASIVTKGTENMLRCLEIQSGSPLTEKEKNATKKNEINSLCPDIANPKYIPTQ